MRVFAILLIMVLLVVVAIGCAEQGANGGRGLNEEPQVEQTLVPKLTYGPEEAKVHIVAFYPLNEKHMAYVKYLNSLADLYPGMVNVVVWDFRTDEGGEACKEAMGKICGGIFINDQMEFTVNIDGKERAVLLEGGEYVSWTKPEVETALAQVVKQEYPDAEIPPLTTETESEEESAD